MKPLIIIAKSLIRLSKNIARIRQILEIVYKDKLEYYEQVQHYNKSKKEKDSDREFYIGEPKLDDYGEPLPELELEELEELDKIQ